VGIDALVLTVVAPVVGGRNSEVGIDVSQAVNDGRAIHNAAAVEDCSFDPQVRTHIRAACLNPLSNPSNDNTDAMSKIDQQ
jgi:hypothetical protein